MKAIYIFLKMNLLLISVFYSCVLCYALFKVLGKAEKQCYCETVCINIKPLKFHQYCTLMRMTNLDTYSDVGVFKREKINLALYVVRLECLFSLFALPQAVFQLWFRRLSL